jgi:hypothetical protein
MGLSVQTNRSTSYFKMFRHMNSIKIISHKMRPITTGFCMSLYNFCRVFIFHYISKWRKVYFFIFYFLSCVGAKKRLVSPKVNLIGWRLRLIKQKLLIRISLYFMHIKK